MLQDELLQAYDQMEEAIDKAPDSPVPFPVVKDEKLNVIGDANETQINNHDFKITFRVPGGEKEAEFKDVFITPRQSGKVVSSLCRMLPFFRKIVDKGVGEYSRDDVIEMLAEFGDEFVDDMYDLVAKVLKIDDALVDYMDVSSVVKATIQILNEYPEVINEAEAFFS